MAFVFLLPQTAKRSDEPGQAPSAHYRLQRQSADKPHKKRGSRPCEKVGGRCRIATSGFHVQLDREMQLEKE